MCISFNTHVLSIKDSFLYYYDETIAKKGADEVTSILYKFCMNHLCLDVISLEGFYNVCAGWNKKFTVLRFMCWIVHIVRHFDSLRMVFPVCGHSYIECDKNFGLLNQRTDVGAPADWWKELCAAREKPRPFGAIKCEQNLLKRVNRVWSGVRPNCSYIIDKVFYQTLYLTFIIC